MIIPNPSWAYGWPVCPADLKANFSPVYFGREAQFAICDLLPAKGNPLILELGSWLGSSMKWMLDFIPGATGICIDRWYGQQQVNTLDLRDEQKRSIASDPDLVFNQFIANMWDYRHRLVPLRNDSLLGMKALHEHGVKPDYIYIDADHGFDGAYNDIATAMELFPDAFIFGDDIQFEDVRLAIEGIASKFGIEWEWTYMTWHLKRNMPIREA